MSLFRRHPFGDVSGRIVATAVLLLAVLPSAHALGAKESEVPSSNDMREYSRGPYGDTETPVETWPLSLPQRTRSASTDERASVDVSDKSKNVRLTVEEAVDLAREGNLGLVSPRIEAATKKRASDLSWNNFLPTVDASGTLSRWNTQQYTYGISGMPPSLSRVPLPTWALSGSLSAQLALNLALFEGVKALKADYEAGLVSYAKVEMQLERDVRKSFYGLLLMQENIHLMEEQIATAKSRYDQTQANYMAGGSSELSALQARVAWENLKPALAELLVNYDAARDAFAMTLGLPRGTVVEPSGEIARPFVDLDADDLISKGLSSRMDVQSLVKSLEAMEIQERALKYQLWTPNLIVGWNADPAFGGDPWKDDLFNNDAWSQASGMFRVTLSMRLNGFLPFSSEAQELAKLRDQEESLRAALALTLRGAETEIDGLVRQLEKSRGSHEALILNIELAERSYRLTDQAYRAGTTELLDVQNAELELRKARLELLKEDYTYVTGLLDLEYAVGARCGTLGGSK